MKYVTALAIIALSVLTISSKISNCIQKTDKGLRLCSNVSNW